LPQYRGAAPINWAIINGEQQTGVTTFFLKHQIDTGKIIFQEEETINPEDDAGTLYQRLMIKGAKLVVKTVSAIEANDYPQTDQEEISNQKNAPKIFKQDCEINFHQPHEKIRNFIRGLAPYPAAWTSLHGKVLKIFKAMPINDRALAPGVFLKDKDQILVGTADQSLSLLEIQLEGKKRMQTAEFLKGYRWPDQ
jgi:methionyl-tRNA formyltransferase